MTEALLKHKSGHLLSHPASLDFVEVIDETQANVNGVERSTKGILRISLSLSGALLPSSRAKLSEPEFLNPHMNQRTILIGRNKSRHTARRCNLIVDFSVTIR